MRTSMRLASVLLLLPVLALASLAQRPERLKPTIFAIQNARVVVEVGKVLPKATVVVRDGVIEAVGPDVATPSDALVIDGNNLTVYPGFIDAMSTWGYDSALRRSETGAPAVEDLAADALAATKADNRKGFTPEFLTGTALTAPGDQAENWRKLGFTAHLVAPEGGLVVGQSALVSLSSAPPREAIIRSPVAMHAALQPIGGNDYPRVLMGMIAHCRQTMLDAGHYQREWQAYEKRGGAGRRPPVDPALAELGKILERKMPVVFEADTRDEINRALDFAEEFKLQPILYGGREGWRVAERLKQQQVPVILRVNFTENMDTFGRRGRGFRPTTPSTDPQQPQTPQRGRRGQGQPQTPASATPAPAEAATPAGESERVLPTRVQDDNKRKQKEEMRTALVLHQNGVLFAFSTQGQTGDRPADKFRENLLKVIAEGLPANKAIEAMTVNAAKILGVDKQLGKVAAGRAAHLVVTDGAWEDSQTQICYVFADGERFEYAKPRSPRKEDTKTAEKKGDMKQDDGKAAAKKAEAKRPAAEDVATEIETDRKPRLNTGGNVLIRGGTVVTVTGGNHANTDVLIRNGRIEKIGQRIFPPEGFAIVDAEGLYVMPGIIDTHCHFAVAGGVNEFSLSVVPEVRIRDVINSDDVQIYRALAGGVTTARLLHGSSNCIGGQDAVIKLKYGQPANKILLADAPRGVKFALGENVKRTDGRFPNTRLGVEAVLVRAFTEAQAYRKTWDDYTKAKADGKDMPEPRRDLRLEALADVLKGDIKVHCHCYRSDEILMLLRIADRFGFKVQSLQHVLEGYKIAPEIAAHGASCSTFSDWWAYKIEAYDAIPFNSALLNEAGATVCLKSDSNELMRHMYQEAAKCIKYGGMTETEALKTITLNGARQLGLAHRIGSIEVGKDADIVLFNGHPLNSYARVEMTMVEGEVYFQRADRPRGSTFAAAGPTPVRDNFRGLPREAGESFAISGAVVHTANGEPLPNRTVLVSKGKITQIIEGVVDEKTPPSDKGLTIRQGGKTTVVQVPAGTQVVNARGLHLFPGMIDAATVLGLTELGSARETQDFAEGGDFQPDLRASTGINPDSELIPVTRANGVLSVVTRPTGSLVAGQSALINLAGWVPREMAVVDPLALHVEFPGAIPTISSDPSLPMVGRAVARKQREEKIRRLKELFQMALTYSDARKLSPDQPVNPRLEAIVPYAKGQKPVIIQANRKQEIVEALQLAEDLKLKVIISGAMDAWKVAADLKKKNVPVIVGPLMTMPAENFDPYDAPYACAARLHEAGVQFCIRSAGTSNTRNLPYEAAMAVSYGLPPQEGLRAVTLYPAQILGVAEQLGSIEVGKRANLVLADGDLLQAYTQVKTLFIDGKPLEPTSKQSRLYQRYRQRLREVREGKAILGTE